MGARMCLEAVDSLCPNASVVHRSNNRTRSKATEGVDGQKFSFLGGSGAAGCGTQTSTSSSSPPSWWESGDARKIFFAPSAVNYESMQCIKSIMLDCIELQESLDFDYKSSS
jgi:hypothetical protein